jgi:hypothetical protein
MDQLSTEPSKMNEALEDFRRTIEAAGERLRLITEPLSLLPRSDGKWSAREIMGHLIDSAANNHQRFVRAQFTDELVFPPYEQEAWVRAQRYNEEPWSLLVQLWQSYNLHLLHVMSAIPAETRTRLCRMHNLQRIAWKTVAESEPVTLEYLMLDYIAHLKNHLKQIFAEG